MFRVVDIPGTRRIVTEVEVFEGTAPPRVREEAR
jgi:hypothetical protein